MMLYACTINTHYTAQRNYLCTAPAHKVCIVLVLHHVTRKVPRSLIRVNSMPRACTLIQLIFSAFLSSVFRHNRLTLMSNCGPIIPSTEDNPSN